jgi:membrane-bound lytic murein transglycosylase F
LLPLAILGCALLAFASSCKPLSEGIYSDAAGSSTGTTGFAGIPAEKAKTALKFENHFRTYGKQFMPRVDWLWFWAQAKQESAFDRLAVSRVGARGVMQIMPATWSEIEGRLGMTANPWSPRHNIMFGIYYDSRMMSQFVRDTTLERIPWMLASYNAGLGSVLRHQGDCGGTRDYELVKPCLYDETRIYVERIRRYYAQSYR